MSTPDDRKVGSGTKVRFADRPVVVFPAAPGLAIEINLEEQEMLEEYEAERQTPASD